MKNSFDGFSNKLYTYEEKKSMNLELGKQRLTKRKHTKKSAGGNLKKKKSNQEKFPKVMNDHLKHNIVCQQ